MYWQLNANGRGKLNRLKAEDRRRKQRREEDAEAERKKPPEEKTSPHRLCERECLDLKILLARVKTQLALIESQHGVNYSRLINEISQKIKPKAEQ